MMSALPVSVVILTYNEEGNLRGCLGSVASWCDDVWVLDSFSTDRTTRIAEDLGARILRRAFDNFAEQRNFAHDSAAFKYEWVLHLDADEHCTEALSLEMASAIRDERYDAYRIASKMMVGPSWLRRAGMYPTYQVRLGKRQALRFRQVGHGQREDVDPGRIGTLKEPYLHYIFSKGMDDWYAKHHRYARDEAREIFERRAGNLDWRGLLQLRDRTRRRRTLKELSSYLPLRPAARFCYVYLIRRGFLDGTAGLRYSLLMASYQRMIDRHLKALRAGAED